MNATRYRLDRYSKVEPDGRKADLAAIHIGAQRLGWSREEYQDIMASVCGGIRSAAQLDFSARKRFLSHIQTCAAANGRTTKTEAKRSPLTGPQKLMWSLWMRLVDAGLADRRSMQSLNAFCERQTQVQRIEWLQPKQQDLLIASLKEWLKRGSNGP